MNNWILIFAVLSLTITARAEIDPQFKRVVQDPLVKTSIIYLEDAQNVTCSGPQTPEDMFWMCVGLDTLACGYKITFSCQSKEGAEKKQAFDVNFSGFDNGNENQLQTVKVEDESINLSELRADFIISFQAKYQANCSLESELSEPGVYPCYTEEMILIAPQKVLSYFIKIENQKIFVEYLPRIVEDPTKKILKRK